MMQPEQPGKTSLEETEQEPEAADTDGQEKDGGIFFDGNSMKQGLKSEVKMLSLGTSEETLLSAREGLCL